MEHPDFDIRGTYTGNDGTVSDIFRSPDGTGRVVGPIDVGDLDSVGFIGSDFTVSNPGYVGFSEGMLPGPLSIGVEKRDWINDFSFDSTEGELNAKWKNNKDYLQEQLEKLSAEYPRGIGIPANIAAAMNKANQYLRGKSSFGMGGVLGGELRGRIDVPNENVGFTWGKKY